jgi:hypothetical protein
MPLRSRIIQPPVTPTRTLHEKSIYRDSSMIELYKRLPLAVIHQSLIEISKPGLAVMISV